MMHAGYALVVTDEQDAPRGLTVEQAAEILGVSAFTVRHRMIPDGLLPSTQEYERGPHRIPARAVEQLASERADPQPRKVLTPEEVAELERIRDEIAAAEKRYPELLRERDETMADIWTRHRGEYGTVEEIVRIMGAREDYEGLVRPSVHRQIRAVREQRGELEPHERPRSRRRRNQSREG